MTVSSVRSPDGGLCVTLLWRLVATDSAALSKMTRRHDKTPDRSGDVAVRMQAPVS